MIGVDETALGRQDEQAVARTVEVGVHAFLGFRRSSLSSAKRKALATVSAAFSSQRVCVSVSGLNGRVP